MQNIVTPKEFFFQLGLSEELTQKCENYLLNTYQVKSFDEVFNITHGELSYIKEILAKETDIFASLQSYIDKEITQTGLEYKLKSVNNEINKIDEEIKNNTHFQALYSIVVGEYENIPHWDDVFNIGDINDIKTENILNNTSNDYSAIISDTIGFNDYNNLNPGHKEILNILFSNIQSFHKINNIPGHGEVKDFLKTFQKAFIKHIQNEKCYKSTLYNIPQNN